MSLIQNNNQTILRRMALRSLKTHPVRAFSLTLAIFLCSCLMMALPLSNTLLFVSSLRDTAHEEDVSYTGLNEEQREALRQDSHFSSVLLSKEGGLGQVEETYVRMAYAQPGNEQMSVYLTEQGSTPADYGETAVDRRLADRLKLRIGDSLTYTDSSGLTEVLTVCGIVKTNTLSSLPYLYRSESYAGQGPALREAPFYLRAKLSEEYRRDPEAAELLLSEIGGALGVADTDITINYVSLYNRPISPEQAFLYLFLDLICLLVGILVIYSIFYLSVMSRVSEFGQMSALGMSSRQIRRMVLWEGQILCMLGISLGILTGALISRLVTGIWSFPYAAGFAVCVFVICYPVILFCLKKPIRAASRLSPVDAQKFQENRTDEKKHPAHLPASPRRLAKIRLGQERKKYFFTTLSVVIGGTLLLLSVSYMHSVDTERLARQTYFRDAEYLIQYDTDYQDISSDTELFDYQKQDVLNEELIEELYSIPEVEKVTAIHMEQAGFSYQDTEIFEEMTMLTEEMIPEIQDSLLEGWADYDRLVQEGGVIYTGSDFYEEAPFQAGDRVSLHYYNGERFTSREVLIAGITEPDYGEKYFTQGRFLISEELMGEMYPGLNTTRYLLVQTKGHVFHDALDTAVQKVVRNRDLITVQTFSEYRDEILRQNQALFLLIGGGCLLVILFGILNILNTMISRMISRSRELALLEAVGMGPRQIRRMLVWECVGLFLPAAAASLLFGGAGGYLLIRFLEGSRISYLAYSFPAAWACLYLIFLFLLPVLLTLGVNRKFAKKGLMERIQITS